jgi:diguanylate cyclase (GGDEF)-like protein
LYPMADKTLILSTSDYPPTPLSPLLPWCREKLSPLNLKELQNRLSELKISPRLADLFISYLKGVPQKREEIILPFENDYQRKRRFQAVLRLFHALIDDDIDKVIIKVTGSYSHYTDSFLSYLEKVTADPLYRQIILINTGEIIPWDGVSKLTPPLSNEIHDEQLFRQAVNFYLFGDNIRACQYFDLLYGKGRTGILNLDARQRADLFRYYGLAALNLKQEDLALTIFSSLQNLGIVWNQKLFTARAYYLTGEVYRRKNETVKAVHFYRKSLEQGIEENSIRFETLLSLCLCQNKGTSFLSKKENEELLQLSSKLQRPKSEGIILLYGKTAPFERILTLFTEKENPLLRAETLYRRGYHNWKEKELPETILPDLNEALRLCRIWKNPTLEAKILSCLGRLEQSLFQMNNAFDYYCQAMKKAVKAELFEETVIIYISLGKMALFLSRPVEARTYLHSARYILNRLPRLSNSFREGVILYTALTYLAEGEKEKGAELVQTLPTHPSEKMVVPTSAVEFLLDNSPLKKEPLAEWVLEKSLLPEYRDLSLYLLWKGRENINLSQEEKDEFFHSLLLEIEKSGEIELNSLREAAERGINSKIDSTWMDEPIDRELMESAIKQYVRYENLKKGMYEINLLSDIQAILAGTEDKDMLILRTMERLLSSSLVNGISYYERMEDSYRLAYHSSLLEEEPDRTDLEDYLASHNREENFIIKGKQDRLFLPVLLEKVLSGVIICRPESLNPKGYEDQRVFSILAGQFSSTLERIKQKELILTKNKQLEEINRELTISNLTDDLTGIGNRTQMNEKLHDFTHKYKGNREKDNFALLFIDLDNFKFYNDTFGHPLGDRILENFSRLLIKVCRESDWIFRYGGDEFVLLLVETDSESSTLIADRILFELDEREGFSELLKENGHENQIPQEKWLCCSIGISDFQKADKKTTNLLHQADEALYQAKEAGKGQWKIYNKDEKNE